MKKLFIALFLTCFLMANANAGYLGNRFSDIEHQEQNVEQFPEITAPSGNPASNTGWLYVKDDGAGTSNLYFEADDGTVTDLLPAGATKWDDVGNPDGANAVDMTTYATVFDWGGTADMMTHEFTANFGDVTGFLLEQKTGNPTNGTIFEIKMADTDPDFASFSVSGVEKVNINDSGDITLSAGDVSCVDATLSGNLSVAGTWEVDAIAATTATQTLTLDGDTTGGVTIGATSTGNVTLGDDVVVSDTYNVTIGEGSLTVDNDQNEIAVTITSDATTAAAGGIGITSATTTGSTVQIAANDVTSGSIIYLESSAAGFTGNYLNCYDGAASDLTIGLYGATTIAGNASTDILTITAGDVEMTAGDLDINNGNLMVDTVQDLAHNISRNYAGAGSAATLTVNEDNTASTSIALDVNNDGTGNATGVKISHDGDLPSLEIVAGAARTGNVIDVAMANQVAQNGLLIDGAWTGASDIGMINLNPTGDIAAGASALRIDTDTGTPGGSGFGIEVDDDSLAGGGYAVLINSANNEGLHVEAGVSLFAELATFTAGINSDAGIDADFAANTETLNVTAAANDYAAGAGTVTVYDDSTGQTNASYLLRLAREANGDAQDHFILCQDNSTGAAANGDDQFAVNSGGDVVMGGASGTGGRLQYSFEDLTIESGGTAASVEVVTSFITTNGDGDEDNATLGDGVQGQVKIFAIAVEGAGGDTWKITPANLNGGSKISFDGVVGDGCTMLFDGTSWNIISNNGGTIS